MHWTQTPEGKERMRRVMVKRWRQKKATGGRPNAPNGHADPAQPRSARALAKQEVHELAVEGARHRLGQLEREMVKLRLFIGREE